MSWLRKAIGALVYLAFLFVFIEVSLQAYYYLTAGDFLFRRVVLPIYANKPNLAIEHHTQEFNAWYYNNAEGFRVPRQGVEYSREKRDGTYRILLLGPSFAYGWAVDYEKSLAGILGGELEARRFAGTRPVEIINAGVPALKAAAGLRWYEHVGATYRPDLVLQIVYGTMAVPNDADMKAVVDDEGFLTHQNATLADHVRERLKKLATVFYGWTVVTRIEERLNVDQSGSHLVRGAGREMASLSKFDLSSPDVIEALAFYRDLDRVVSRDGTKLVVVYTPLSYAVHPADFARWKHLGVNDANAQIAFDSAFARYLNEQGMSVVDATNALQQSARQGERLYFWLDIHWTPKGNEVAARAVADYLTTTRGNRDSAQPSQN